MHSKILEMPYSKENGLSLFNSAFPNQFEPGTLGVSTCVCKSLEITYYMFISSS